MLTADLIPTDNGRVVALKKKLGDQIDTLLARYEAELYQERYLPEYQSNAREISRREKQKDLERAQRDREALERVAALSEDAD